MSTVEKKANKSYEMSYDEMALDMSRDIFKVSAFFSIEL